MKEGRGSDAVAQTVAFVVATSFFLGIFGTLLVATNDTPPSDGSEVQDATNRVGAEQLADALVGSPGTGWISGPDAVTRIGFLHEDGGQLDSDHLDALRGASYEADPDNGKLDYEEALESLGLPTDGTLGFHVRLAPVGLQKVLQAADLSHIRTAYLGDWGELDADIEVGLDTDATMVADARAQVDLDMDLLVPNERQVLVDLGVNFDDRVHLDAIDIDVDMGLGLEVSLSSLVPAGLLDGDVYPDDKLYLNSVFDGRLGEYDLLVVGSTVDHSSLTSNSVKDSIRDWVLAGGTLLVFGSESSNFQWLQPLFHVGTSTVNAAPAAPDVSHPMLHEPNALDWTAYDNHGLGWDLPESGNNAIFDDFQHIISSDDEDVLTISNEGVFGDGRVFLTTYRPSEVADVLSHEEATNFVHNVVLFDDRAHLYLDYGPTPPADAAVSAAIRTTQIYDEDLGMISMRLTLLYWGV